MLVIIYIVSAVFGFANFVQFNRGEEILGKFMLKAFFAFALALTFCFFRYKGFVSGKINFTVMNLFAMFLLLAFHINLWLNIFEDVFSVFIEKFGCSILIAFVCACACWLCFAIMF